MRLWARTVKHNKQLAESVIENYDWQKTRTEKVLEALQDACTELDLPVPMWLDGNIRDFQRSGKTRFRTDSFIESVDFDYLEFSVLEDDY